MCELLVREQLICEQRRLSRPTSLSSRTQPLPESLQDSGETSSQIVLVIPVVIAILMIAIQAGVYFHTSNVAGAAASHGAAAAAARSSTSQVVRERGSTAALQILRDAGTRVAAPPRVSMSAESVTVTVEAHVPKIIPLFPSVVRRTATEPRERFLIESMR
jgi:hypothetical protein